MKLPVILVAIITVFQSCTSKQKDFDEKFLQVVDGIPTVQLPLKLGYSSGTPPITDSTTRAWNDQFFAARMKGVWGRVFLNQPNIHLLATQADDQGTVFLVTFDKFGKLLSEEALQRGYFILADPEFITDNYATLYPDMKLIETDSLFKYPTIHLTTTRAEGDVMCKVTHQEHTINPEGTLNVIRYDTTDFFKTSRRP